MNKREREIEDLRFKTFTALPRDVKELITMWEADPCWDLETSDGYEPYHNQLRIYVNAGKELEQLRREQKKKDELEHFVNKFHLRQGWTAASNVNSHGLFELLMDMAQRIEELEDKVHELEMK